MRPLAGDFEYTPPIYYYQCSIFSSSTMKQRFHRDKAFSNIQNLGFSMVKIIILHIGSTVSNSFSVGVIFQCDLCWCTAQKCRPQTKYIIVIGQLCLINSADTDWLIAQFSNHSVLCYSRIFHRFTVSFCFSVLWDLLYYDFCSILSDNLWLFLVYLLYCCVMILLYCYIISTILYFFVTL